MRMYLDRLFQVENFPVDLVSNHASVHLRIHHLYGRHGLKQTKSARDIIRFLTKYSLYKLNVCVQSN